MEPKSGCASRHLTFADPGEFVVTTTATNLCGSHSDDINITVDSIPDVQFELPGCRVTARDTLLVIATGAESYTWANSVDFMRKRTSQPLRPHRSRGRCEPQPVSASANGCTTSDTLN